MRFPRRQLNLAILGGMKGASLWAWLWLVLGIVYFVLPLVHIPAPSIPTEVWLMFGGILGVASWFRGKAQQAQAEMTPGTPDAKG